MRSRVARTVVVLSFVGLVPATALAGPPLLCFPMVIDGAKSLAWGTGGWNSPLPSYDLSRLADETTALLAPETPVIVRMETLRRAVIYAAKDGSAADGLFVALRGRLAAAPAGRGAALAQFDLGYALEAFRQTRHLPNPTTVAPGDDGYALIERALAAHGPDPAMEYAAALVSASRMFRSVSDAHLRRATAGARAGSILARTIEAHQPIWGDRVAASMRSASH